MIGEMILLVIGIIVLICLLILLFGALPYVAFEAFRDGDILWGFGFVFIFCIVTMTLIGGVLGIMGI